MDVVEILLEKGADIEAQSERTKDTALSLACSGGRYEVIFSCTPSEKKNQELIILCLFSEPLYLVIVDKLIFGNYLSISFSPKVVELLLSKNANKEHRNVSDYTPLSLAASGGYVAIIKLLLSQSAEINSR